MILFFPFPQNIVLEKYKSYSQIQLELDLLFE